MSTSMITHVLECD